LHQKDGIIFPSDIGRTGIKGNQRFHSLLGLGSEEGVMEAAVLSFSIKRNLSRN
jgi:hypothetical protein